MEETKRKLASIQRIVNLEPIEGADAIEKATVLGWSLVVKKNEFKVGDLCVYFEVDSLLPLLPEFDFLKNNGTKTINVDGRPVEGYRLKTVRLRGQVSQGLAFSINKLITTPNSIDLKEGQDVTGILGVYKYEQPLSASLSGVARGYLSDFVPKTDEERLQTCPKILERYKDISFYVTEKVDGSSTTFFIKDGEFHAAGRTIDFKEESNNTIWKMAKELKLEEKLKTMPDIALQGEIIGEKIQDNKLKLTGHKILFFNAYNLANRQYLSFNEFEEIIKKFELESVPVIDKEFKLLPTVEEMVKSATIKSFINPQVWAEGLVFRPLQEMRDEDLGRLSFKVINPEFLLEYKE